MDDGKLLPPGQHEPVAPLVPVTRHHELNRRHVVSACCDFHSRGTACRARAARTSCHAIDESVPVSVLECKLFAGQFEAVEVADNACGDALRLKEFLRDFLHVFRRHFFKQRDQLDGREIAVEIHVIASQAVHPLAGAFRRQQRCAFQMILGAAQLLFRKRLILDPAEFIEHGANELRNILERCPGIHRKSTPESR